MEAEHERKVKRTVSLSAEASRLLDVQALGMGVTISAVVEWLVVAWCGDYELKSGMQIAHRGPIRRSCLYKEMNFQTHVSCNGSYVARRV